MAQGSTQKRIKLFDLPQAKSKQRSKEFKEKEAAEYQAGDFQALYKLLHPGLIILVHLASNQLNEDICEERGHI